MARKFKSTERFMKPDPKFKSLLAAKFINCLMREGKKNPAQRAFYDAMDLVTQRVKDVDPIEVFNTAINNVKPLIEVRSRRVGGATYQVPKEVGRKRQMSLAMRWIRDAARGRKGKPLRDKLADEIVAAYKREGAAMQVRENLHKMAEANKAFAHFAW